MAEPAGGPGADPIEVTPVVVIARAFPARPSSIPDIRDFVRHCLAESPLTEEGNREVGGIVFRALLDAAGPTGSIQVAFRIFPDTVEVDVLHSDSPVRPAEVPGMVGPPAWLGGTDAQSVPVPAAAGAGTMPAPGATGAAPRSEQAGRGDTFSEWMTTTLRREGLTQEAAARMLGVSVKTVSRWVGGATEPRLRDLRRIKEVFGQIPLP
jgi:DNA-binding XRE family transcriptional regulator